MKKILSALIIIIGFVVNLRAECKGCPSAKLDFQKAIDIIARAILDDGMDVTIVKRISMEDFFSKTKTPQETRLSALKSARANGKFEQFFSSFDSLKSQNSLFVYPTKFTGRGGPIYQETGSFSAQLPFEFSWFMVLSLDEKYEDFSIVNLPDQHNGVFKKIKDNRLQVDMDTFYADLKIIYAAVQGVQNSLPDAPEQTFDPIAIAKAADSLQTPLAKEVLQSVINIKTGVVTEKKSEPQRRKIEPPTRMPTLENLRDMVLPNTEQK